MNDEAFDTYNTSALVPCDGCGRTFLPDSLKRHIKGCKGAGVKGKPSGAMGGGGPGMVPKKEALPQVVRPKALMCYICGREFGTASLEIHLKSCKKKWDLEQALKPKNERRPCPTAPEEFNEALGGSGNKAYDMESYNAKAFDAYNTKALEPCLNCGRTFLPDSLKKHAKMCKGPVKGSTIQPPSAMGNSMAGKGIGGGLSTMPPQASALTPMKKKPEGR
jgi:hypothetical protein